MRNTIDRKLDASVFNANEWRIIHDFFRQVIGPNQLSKSSFETALLEQLQYKPTSLTCIQQVLYQITHNTNSNDWSTAIKDYLSQYLEPSNIAKLKLGKAEVHLKSIIDIFKYVYFNSQPAWLDLMGTNTPMGTVAEEQQLGEITHTKAIDNELKLYLKDQTVESFKRDNLIYNDKRLVGIKTKGGRQVSGLSRTALVQVLSFLNSQTPRPVAVRSKANLKKKIIIIGSGPVGAVAAKILCQSQFDVTILEAGTEQDKDKYELMEHFVRNNEYWQSELPWRYEVNGYDLDLNTWAIRKEGGSSNGWNGSTPRFLESDFVLHSQYGIAVDWPITYQEIEPYYVKAEYLMGICGEQQDPLESYRSMPYPMPAHPMKDYDLLVKEAALKLNIDFHTIPGARNSQVYDDRSKCLSYGVCRACPIDAKFTAAHTIKQLKKLSNFSIQYQAYARKVEVDDNGLFTINYQQQNISKSLDCDLVILAGYVVGNINLLQKSASERFSNGLANGSNTLGKYLMDHPRFSMTGSISQRVDGYRNGFETSSSLTFHNHPQRHQYAASRILVHRRTGPWPYELAMASNLTGKALQMEIKRQFAKFIRLDVLMEQLPILENQVSLSEQLDDYGDPIAKINYGILSKYEELAHQKMRQKVYSIFECLNANNIIQSDIASCGHFMGGHRMGNDPKTSVTNSYLESHDIKKLFIAGSGAFPTGGTSNPTLTSIALTIRMAEYICRYYS